MSTGKNYPPSTARSYRITVEGTLDPSWSDWLGGIKIEDQKEAKELHFTILSGILRDQAALRGLLNRLWDLNLVLCSVEQVDPAPTLKKEQGG